MPLAVEGLAKTYSDGTRALRGVDLRLDRGLFGLLGPNGAGKTTLLSMLVLAQEPTAGRRLYEGRDAAVLAHRPQIRRMIGYLPQDFTPIRQLTGLEYLLHCARLREVGLTRRALQSRAWELLAVVGLEGDARRRSGTYSGGMARRLGLAQALIHAPRLVVVDEPTAGLDPEERFRFRNYIAEVAAGATVLLSTHIVEDVEATCSRLGVIAGGGLLFEGRPSELMSQALGRLWLLPLGAAPPAGARRAGRRVSSGGEVREIVEWTGSREGEDSGSGDYRSQQSQQSQQALQALHVQQGFAAAEELREFSLEEAYSAFLARHEAPSGGEAQACG
ncbi:MAG TPA: ATP-binding cassette domain-containing protein [Thermoanaerobaculia bacterium]|nr:ATP-binding cassette domain-containing protein [Thermoanaerobaculia bacterium]